MSKKFLQKIFTFLKIELAVQIITAIFFFFWVAADKDYWFGGLDKLLYYYGFFYFFIFIFSAGWCVYFQTFQDEMVKSQNSTTFKVRLFLLSSFLISITIFGYLKEFTFLDFLFNFLFESFNGIIIQTPIFYLIYLISQIVMTVKKLNEIKNVV